MISREFDALVRAGAIGELDALAFKLGEELPTLEEIGEWSQNIAREHGLDVRGQFNGRNYVMVDGDVERVLGRQKIYATVERGVDAAGEAIKGIVEDIARTHGPGKVWHSTPHLVTFASRGETNSGHVATRVADDGVRRALMVSYYVHSKSVLFTQPKESVTP